MDSEPTATPPTNFDRWAGDRMTGMSVEEIEAEALKLDPKDRARLAEKLLASLETLSDQENDRLWAEEAQRRDADWESAPGTGRPAADVLRDARAKLKTAPSGTLGPRRLRVTFSVSKPISAQ